MSLSEQDKQEITEIVREIVREETKPMNDIFVAWGHLKAQAMFWVGGMLALGGAIQAIQTLWDFIIPHIKS